MKLKIKETAWGINRVQGGCSKRTTAEQSFPCEAGALPSFGKGERRFVIDKVEGGSILLSVHCADPKYDRTWKIQRGEIVLYRPRSFDGGYFYHFKLI